MIACYNVVSRLMSIMQTFKCGIKSFKRTTTLIFFISAFFAGRSEGQQRNTGVSTDSFSESIIRELGELSLSSITILQLDDQNIFTPTLPARDHNGNYIIFNAGDSRIYLIDKSGNVLDRAGGEGHGPGEFMGLNDPVITAKNHLFILDHSQKRVTEYKIKENKLEFLRVETLTPTGGIHPTGSECRYIYATEKGIVGMYTIPKGFVQGVMRRNIALYLFDDKFKTTELIKEFEGHYPDILFGGVTVSNIGWFVNGNTLNYYYTDSLKIYSIDLDTQVIKRIALTNSHRDRIQTDMNQKNIDARFSSIMNMPGMRGSGSSPKLPIVHNAFGEGNIFVTQISYFGGDYTALVVYNLQTGSKRGIKAPPSFYLHGVYGNEIYGLINRPGEGNQFVILTL